jgi:hypothetical protein
MELKNLSLIDENLVKFLRKKYPPIEYKEGLDREKFLSQSIFRSGQRDVIYVIEHLIALQKGVTNAK